MYIEVAKCEIYIERRNGPIVWKPLIENGEEGLVIVFMVIWIAVNRKSPCLELDDYWEKHDGKKQN
jgi:hypothetical protein